MNIEERLSSLLTIPGAPDKAELRASVKGELQGKAVMSGLAIENEAGETGMDPFYSRNRASDPPYSLPLGLVKQLMFGNASNRWERERQPTAQLETITLLNSTDMCSFLV